MEAKIQELIGKKLIGIHANYCNSGVIYFHTEDNHCYSLQLNGCYQKVKYPNFNGIFNQEITFAIISDTSKRKYDYMYIELCTKDKNYSMVYRFFKDNTNDNYKFIKIK